MVASTRPRRVTATKKSAESAPPAVTKTTNKRTPKKTTTKKANTKKSSRAASTKKSSGAASTKKSRPASTKKSRPASTKKATSAKKTKSAKPKKTTQKKDDTAVVIADCEDNLELLLKNHVSKELLVELLVCSNISVVKSQKKPQVVQQVMETTIARGLAVVVETLKKPTMAAFVKELKGSDAASPNNRSELQRELKEQLDTIGGLENALNKLTVGTLDVICEDLGFKEEGSKKDKVDGLIDETRILGIKALFERSNYNFMKELCSKAGLSTLGQKGHLVSRFLGQAYRFMLDDAKVEPRAPKQDKKEKKEKKEKKPKEQPPAPDVANIKAGISTLELHQYYSGQLTQYIKENNLKRGKNKKDMVNIISAFLKGDEKVVRNPDEKKKGGKRKRETSEADSESNKKQKTE